jgi:hypothetical protein
VLLEVVVEFLQRAGSADVVLPPLSGDVSEEPPITRPATERQKAICRPSGEYCGSCT